MCHNKLFSPFVSNTYQDNHHVLLVSLFNVTEDDLLYTFYIFLCVLFPSNNALILKIAIRN